MISLIYFVLDILFLSVPSRGQYQSDVIQN